VLALSDVSATIGLLAIFVVLFPILVQGIIAYIAVRIVAEHRQNEDYRNGRA
jgi:hypothetical protein